MESTFKKCRWCGRRIKGKNASSKSFCNEHCMMKQLAARGLVTEPYTEEERQAADALIESRLAEMRKSGSVSSQLVCDSESPEEEARIRKLIGQETKKGGCG